MRLAICGAGCFGQYLNKKIQGLNVWEAKCYVDNTSNLSRDLPVISYRELRNKWHEEIDGVIVAVSNYYFLGDIIMQLHDEGIESILIAKPELWIEKPDVSIDQIYERYIYQLNIQDKAVITKLEYHVCDACNLNCKGCSHFAPIFKNGFSTVDSFRKDMEQLSKRFSNILRLRLMGGEPFLHKELSLFVRIARESFPYSHLEIVTNGLLIEDAGADIWDSIKECNAVLQISLYPPTYTIKERLEQFLKEREIPFSFGSGLEQYNDEGIIREFHKNLTEYRNHDPEKAIKVCMGNRCHYLRDGKISKCALPLLAPKINRYFGSKYIVEPTDTIDIYDETIPAWEVVRRLYKSTPFCGYCTTDGLVRFAWAAHAQIELSDYVIQEEQG